MKARIAATLAGVLALAATGCDDGSTDPVVDVTPPEALIAPVGLAFFTGQDAFWFIRGADSVGLVSRTISFDTGDTITESLGGIPFEQSQIRQLYVEPGSVTARIVYADAAGNLGSDSITVEIRDSFRPLDGEWSRDADLAEAVRGAGAVSLEARDQIVVFGGFDASGQPTGTTQIVDVAVDGVSLGREMPLPAGGVSAAVGPDGVHVIGGTNGAALAAHRLYDPSADGWTSLPDLPVPIAGAVAEVIDGRLYVAGGTSAALVYSDSVYVYDIAGGTWTQGPPLPGARRNAASAVYLGRLHVVGGGVPGDGTTASHAVFDPTTGEWSEAPPYPGPVETLTLGVIANQLIGFGGRIAAADGLGTPQGDAYLLGATEWFQTRNRVPPALRGGAASAAVNDRLYALGGHDASGAVTPTVSSFGR